METLERQRDNWENLANRVIEYSLSTEKREEEIWLKDHYQTFLHTNGINRREEGDQLLCRRMAEITAGSCNDAGEQLPRSSAYEVLKIRYWRTGRHYPKNRAACEVFGQALDLDVDEQRDLMINWFNRADRCFGPEDSGNTEYQKRS